MAEYGIDEEYYDEGYTGGESVPRWQDDYQGEITDADQPFWADAAEFVYKSLGLPTPVEPGDPRGRMAHMDNIVGAVGALAPGLAGARALPSFVRGITNPQISGPKVKHMFQNEVGRQRLGPQDIIDFARLEQDAGQTHRTPFTQILRARETIPEMAAVKNHPTMVGADHYLHALDQENTTPAMIGGYAVFKALAQRFPALEPYLIRLQDKLSREAHPLVDASPPSLSQIFWGLKGFKAKPPVDFEYWGSRMPQGPSTP